MGLQFYIILNFLTFNRYDT